MNDDYFAHRSHSVSDEFDDMWIGVLWVEVDLPSLKISHDANRLHIRDVLDVVTVCDLNTKARFVLDDLRRNTLEP
jgi:hypothetical protein